jgi:cytochrome c peroxidase
MKMNLVKTSVLFILIALLATGCKDEKTNVKADKNAITMRLENKTLQDLGEKLFFDTTLSDPEGQSCAACHSAETGWTGPDVELNKKGGIYEGAFKGRFGNRKPNSAAYSTFAPVFHAVVEDGDILFVGGKFWDGRATGYLLGNPAADQAQGPFLNPVEHNIPDAKTLISKILKSNYVGLFNKAGEEIWGIKNIAGSEDVNFQFGVVGLAIAAFESSEKVSPFTSKFDYYLKGKAELTELEKRGFDLFNGKGMCSECHPGSVGEDGTPPLFTDFTFDNLGFPANPDNPWYSMDPGINPEGAGWSDEGLKDLLETLPQYAMYADENAGKHQVPTLRNVDKRPFDEFVKAYGHNGYFKTLEDVVHFYNTRDVILSDAGTKWPEPEIRRNMNTTELGNLGLTADEEAAIVAFLKTLSDGYR